MAKASRKSRKKSTIRIEERDLRVSEGFIAGMRDFGVSKDTLLAAERRNERVAHKRTAAAG